MTYLTLAMVLALLVLWVNLCLHGERGGLRVAPGPLVGGARYGALSDGQSTTHAEDAELPVADGELEGRATGSSSARSA